MRNVYMKQKRKENAIYLFFASEIIFKIFYTVLSVLANISTIDTLQIFGCYVIYCENTPKIK